MSIPYEPYFYLTCRVSRISHLGVNELTRRQGGTESIVEEWLLKRYEGIIIRIEREKKWDLSLVSCGQVMCWKHHHTLAQAHSSALSFQPNHLLSAPPVFLKLFFHNTADLQTIRRDLLPLARSNSEKFTAVDAYADVVSAEAAANGHGDDENRAWGAEDDTKKKKDKEPSECIIEVREHDLAYHLRVAIDLSELFTIIQLTRESALISRTIRYSCRTLVYRHLPHGRYNAGTNTRSCQACGPSRHGV